MNVCAVRENKPQMEWLHTQLIKKQKIKDLLLTPAWAKERGKWTHTGDTPPSFSLLLFWFSASAKSRAVNQMWLKSEPFHPASSASSLAAGKSPTYCLSWLEKKKKKGGARDVLPACQSSDRRDTVTLPPGCCCARGLTCASHQVQSSLGVFNSTPRNCYLCRFRSPLTEANVSFCSIRKINTITAF